MALIPKTNIATGNTILASDITNIINSLNETGSYTIIATGSFSGSFTGLADSSSYALSSSYGVSASYALSGSYVVSASYGVSASYAGSSSYSNIAQTASFYGGTLPFQNLSSLPASLSGSGGAGGVSAVRPALTAVSYTASIDLITYNGAFFPIDAQAGAVNILLDDLGGSNKIGTEFVFFATDATNDITFSSVTGTTTIICSGSLSNPKIAGTGLAVVAKFIERSGVPYKWAVIGGIKA